jgi:hypothetical protein
MFEILPNTMSDLSATRQLDNWLTHVFAARRHAGIV